MLDMVDILQDKAKLLERELDITEKDAPSLEDFELLVEDRTFSDYFNVYLSLPVFGQRAIYDVIERDFQFCPSVRRQRDFVHRKGLLQWLYTERYLLFCNTDLYLEYLLCCKLQHVGLVFESTGKGDTLSIDDPDASKNFTRNLLGHVMGMQLFRDALKGTHGEKVYQCWLDAKKLHRIVSVEDKRYEINRFKQTYLISGADKELADNYKEVVYHGFLNFEIIPEEDEHMLNAAGVKVRFADFNFDTDSLDTFISLQTLLLRALTRYWLPRYIIHIINSLPTPKLQELFEKDSVTETDVVNIQQFLKCRKLFPSVTDGDETDVDSITTSSCYDDSNYLTEAVAETVATTPQEEDKEGQTTITDLLSLCGGMRLDVKSSVEEHLSSPDGSLCTRDSLTASPSEKTNSNLYNPALFLGSASTLLEITSNSNITENSISSTTMSGIEPPNHEPMSPLLKHFIYGFSAVARLETRVTDKVLCGIASDHLAGFPFRKFLRSKGLSHEIRCLSFWNDVHYYNQLEEENILFLKQKYAQTIMETYLLSNDEENKIFSESLKLTLIKSLSEKNEESLLYAAHDLVSNVLHLAWRKFIRYDRRMFVKVSCGKRLDYYASINHSSDTSPTLTTGEAGSSPLYLDQSKTPYGMLMEDKCNSPEESLKGKSSVNEAMTTKLCDATSFKSFEYAILLSYINADGSTYNSPLNIWQALKSPLGSLCGYLDQPVYKEWLKNLVHPQKVKIEAMKVSKKVEKPVEEEELIEALELEGISSLKGRNGRLLRRNGVMLVQPNKPRSFMEVLSTREHFEFFRRYLINEKALQPLLFWKCVEDMKHTMQPQTCQLKANQIFRRFFGRHANHGEALDSKDDIIKMLSSVSKASPGMLLCAQSCIYRMMERKWYPGYLESFPPNAELKDVHMSESDLDLIKSRNNLSNDNVSWVPEKKVTEKKTHHLWNRFIKLLRKFLSAMRNKTEVILFERYLKQMNKERQDSSDGIVNEKKNKDTVVPTASSTVGATGSNDARIILNNKVVSLTKLPRDLHFWLEVTRYREQYQGFDYAKGGITKEDMDLLTEKAKAIVNCFLASDIAPRVQVNVASDMAITIANNLHLYGPQRSLFHETSILLFPVLYHFWRRFCDEWLKDDTAERYMKKHEHSFKHRVVHTPHTDSRPPDYQNVDSDDIKTFTFSTTDDTWFRINFTILSGIRILLPKLRGSKSGEFDEAEDESTPLKSKSAGRRSVVSIKSRPSVQDYKKQSGDSSRHKGKEDGRLPTKQQSIIEEDAFLPTSSKNDRRRSSTKAKDIVKAVQAAIKINH